MKKTSRRSAAVIYTTWFEEYSDDFFTANASDIEEREMLERNGGLLMF